jgi:hypothetical protein
MARSIDLQDNLSKTQGVEKVFKVLQQGPELDQRQFALNLKRAINGQKEKVEETQRDERTKIKDEHREQTREDRYESQDGKAEPKVEPETKRKNEERQSPASESDHRVDMTV